MYGRGVNVKDKCFQQQPPQEKKTSLILVYLIDSNAAVHFVERDIYH